MRQEDRAFCARIETTPQIGRDVDLIEEVEMLNQGEMNLEKWKGSYIIMPKQIHN